MNSASINKSEIHGSVHVGDNNTYKIVLPPADPQGMASALARFQALSENDDDFQYFMERLDFFTSQNSRSPVIGLEKKLTNAGRQDLLEVAVERKDAFAKRIMRSQLSRRRQWIFYYILQKIDFYFTSQIKPLIRQRQPSEVIDAVIMSGIVEVIYREVMAEDPTIDLHTISGMLYFLTGKCHLVWEV
ncbi:hypothetical protein N5D61_16685 [Pseudomonas sp. GD03842]|uniref:ABC-three component system protein n=1 Tax=Pseudomonas sp. GD03842 TaxID=2975385 RepID=UPI002448D885|nr:ABC-three component system protein [Pseudomonas sp. GD03842]MDH0747969.1 hypothetical protein [Pseudomonas sp. GD03842]